MATLRFPIGDLLQVDDFEGVAAKAREAIELLRSTLRLVRVGDKPTVLFWSDDEAPALAAIACTLMASDRNILPGPLRLHLQATVPTANFDRKFGVGSLADALDAFEYWLHQERLPNP